MYLLYIFAHKKATKVFDSQTRPGDPELVLHIDSTPTDYMSSNLSDGPNVQSCLDFLVTLRKCNNSCTALHWCKFVCFTYFSPI